ncbi:hypothetical protein MKEN_00217900 [Mycena kentingensis (nom. inval.)]|nr:hypothetical protein MKEN_00217900 [Mycena kentingensis (nom. inval.)]
MPSSQPTSRPVIIPPTRHALLRQAAQSPLRLYPPIHDGRNSTPDPHELLPLRRRIQATRDQVLEYDEDSKLLVAWDWPANPVNGERIPPDLLSNRAPRRCY